MICSRVWTWMRLAIRNGHQSSPGTFGSKTLRRSTRMAPAAVGVLVAGAALWPAAGAADRSRRAAAATPAGV